MTVEASTRTGLYCVERSLGDVQEVALFHSGCGVKHASV